MGRSSSTDSSTTDLAAELELVAQINQDRYETLAARVLGVKGAGIFGHAEDAVFAGLALDTNAPIEFWYPQRIYRWGLGRFQAAHATERGGFELRNSTTDQLWVLEHIGLVTLTATVSSWQLWVGEDTTADFYATTLLGTGLDTRIPGSSSQDFGSQGTGLATIPGFGQIAHEPCATGTLCSFNPGVILAPGGSFIANNTETNMTIWCSMIFHTRQAMPGELA